MTQQPKSAAARRVVYAILAISHACAALCAPIRPVRLYHTVLVPGCSKEVPNGFSVKKFWLRKYCAFHTIQLTFRSTFNKHAGN
eukprot:SAG25_NODE_30_length_20554_cov_36.028694_15_plen_84_part_00